jgi:putative hydrolase of HD superfamily
VTEDHASDAAGLARFFHRAGGLKATSRTGWLDRGIPAIETESVADHTFRTALLAWIVALDDPGLDANRVLALALLHDLAEAVTGDLPPYDPEEMPTNDDPAALKAFLDRRHVRSEERRLAKQAAERAAMADLIADLHPASAARVSELWAELEAGESAEARFVKQADKVETYLQSREYAAAGPDRSVASFAAEVASVITAPGLVALRDAIAGLNVAESTGEGNPSADAEISRIAL